MKEQQARVRLVPTNMESGQLGKVATQLLLEVKHQYNSNSYLSDDLLSALQDVFGGSLQASLDIVDRRGVTHVTSPSGRHVYLVVGSSGRLYTCLPSGLYCPCTFFTYAALMKGQALACKHVLAVQLAQAINTCQQLSVTDEELSGLLMDKHTAQDS